MTEKSYGGSTGIPTPKSITKTKNSQEFIEETKKKKMESESRIIEPEEMEKLKQAGEIAKKVKQYIRPLIKQGTPLLEIAEKIENKIVELGGKPAFPTGLAINEIAAHSTPTYNDETKAEGLLKVDLGVQIDGYVADTAFSMDLDNNEENKKLIEAAEKALGAAIKTTTVGTPLNKIGAAAESEIQSKGFEPIRNLSGHEIEQWDLHAGLTIPGFDNSQPTQISEGTFAIEPFSTNGVGAVREGKPSGIYMIESENNVRDRFAREILDFIVEEYQTLPFCSRWLVKKFGTRALLAISQIERAGILHHYPQLIEKGNGKVAQAEHTIILTKKETIITT